jgi:hypothetical protein
MGFRVWALGNKNSKNLIFSPDNFDVPNLYFSFLSLFPGPIEHNTGIYLKKRHTETFRGILHVCQAILETGSGRKLSHNGCTAAILTYPTMVFYF